MQASAAEARKRNRLAREGNAQLAGGSPPAGNDFNITRARRIERLIDQVIKELAATSDAKEQQAKATALDRLYGTWADMTGHERRGVSKTRKRRAQDPRYDLQLEPVEQ